MKLIKSSSDDEIETLSDRLESYLIDTSTFMKRVVSNTFSSSIIALSFSMLVHGGKNNGILFVIETEFHDLHGIFRPKVNGPWELI